MVLSEVLSGSISREAAKRKYGIGGNSTITKWIVKFGNMKNPKVETDSKESKSIEVNDEIAFLKKALELERLKSEAYSEMITIAEKEFNIQIRKKSGAKQS